MSKKESQLPEVLVKDFGKEISTNIELSSDTLTSAMVSIHRRELQERTELVQAKRKAHSERVKAHQKEIMNKILNKFSKMGFTDVLSYVGEQESGRYEKLFDAFMNFSAPFSDELSKSTIKSMRGHLFSANQNKFTYHHNFHHTFMVPVYFDAEDWGTDLDSLDAINRRKLLACLHVRLSYVGKRAREENDDIAADAAIHIAAVPSYGLTSLSEVPDNAFGYASAYISESQLGISGDLEAIKSLEGDIKEFDEILSDLSIARTKIHTMNEENAEAILQMRLGNTANGDAVLKALRDRSLGSGKGSLRSIIDKIEKNELLMLE